MDEKRLEDQGTTMPQATIDNQDRHRIMTVEEVAEYLRKSPSWVYKNWRKLGGVKLGGSLMFSRQGGPL